jgi:hypothetical protein
MPSLLKIKDNPDNPRAGPVTSAKLIEIQQDKKSVAWPEYPA